MILRPKEATTRQNNIAILVGLVLVSVVCGAASLGRAATRVFLTPDVAFILPGETAVFDVWVEDTVSAGMGPLWNYQIEVPCDATPVGVVTTTVSHDVSGASPHIDSARADFVFSSCVQDASCPVFPAVDFGSCPFVDPRFATAVGQTSFSVDVIAPAYLGEVSYTASSSGTGTFAFDVVPGVDSFLRDVSGGDIPFTTSPATIHVVQPPSAHVFFVPEESTIQPGETVDLEVWLEDTVSAGMGPLRDYQIKVPCDATPLGAFAGTVSVLSPNIDTARADFVFSSCVQDASCSAFPVVDAGACPSVDPRFASAVLQTSFSVDVIAPVYLGDVSYTASSSGVASTFEIDIVTGPSSFLRDDLNAIIPFTTSPATVHVEFPTRVFMVPDRITVAPGERFAIELWVDGTVSAGMGPIREHHVSLKCNATKVYGLGFVQHQSAPGSPPISCADGESPCIDTAHPDYVYATVPSFEFETYSNCVIADPSLKGLLPGPQFVDVMPGQPKYLGEFGFFASNGAAGEFDISIQNPNEQGAGGSGNGGSYVRNEFAIIVPFSVDWPGVRVYACNCEPPLPEDSLGLSCVNDTSCPNRSLCIDNICYYPKNRYLSFNPNPANSATPKAFRVTLVASENHPGAVGRTAWVGAPDPGGFSLLVNNPVTRTWNEPTIHLTGCLVSPVAEYEIQSTPDGGTTFSGPLTIPTAAKPVGGRWWGDTVGFFNGSVWTPPQGTTNIDDAVAAIKTWQNETGAPHRSVTDVEPQDTNRVVNFNDVFREVQAFQGSRYPFGCAADPCQNNIVAPCP